MGASPIKTLHFLATPEIKHSLANRKFKGKYEEIISDLQISNVLERIKHDILMVENTLLEDDVKYYYSYGNENTTIEQREKIQHDLLSKYFTLSNTTSEFIKPKHMPLRWYGMVYPYIIIFTRNKVIYKFILDEMITDKPWEYIYKNELLRLNQHIPDIAAAITQDIAIIPYSQNGATQYFTTAYDSLGLLDLKNVNNTSVLIEFNSFRSRMHIEQLLISLSPKLKKLKKYNRQNYIATLEGTIFSMLSKLYRANEVQSLKIQLLKDAQTDLFVVEAIINHLFNTNALSHGHYNELHSLLYKIENYLVLYIKYLNKIRDSKNYKK